MTIRNSIVSVLGICAVGLAGGLGCQHAQPGPRDGTIDFVVRQGRDIPAAGSFDVRGIDTNEHARVGIGSGTARIVHVRLPAGAYAVSWNPATPVDAAGRPRSAQPPEAADQHWPQIVVVTPETASVVDVLVTPQRRGRDSSLQLASLASRSTF